MYVHVVHDTAVHVHVCSTATYVFDVSKVRFCNFNFRVLRTCTGTVHTSSNFYCKVHSVVHTCMYVQMANTCNICTTRVPVVLKNLK